jgi:hypothetical protein
MSSPPRGSRRSSPTTLASDGREPNLSLEEFGHLVQAAFDMQTLRLGFPNPNQLSRPQQSRVDEQAQHQQSYLDMSPPRKSPVKKVSSALKWLSPSPNRKRLPPPGHIHNSPGSPSSPYASLSSPSPGSPGSSVSGPRHPKSMFSNLRTKLSLECLPTRRQPVPPSSPLFHSFTPSDPPPPVPRPAPFFYSRSRIRLSPIPDRPQNQSTPPSGTSLDSDEIQSWRNPKTKVIYAFISFMLALDA